MKTKYKFTIGIVSLFLTTVLLINLLTKSNRPAPTQISTTFTPFLEKRILGYTIQPDNNLIIYSALSNQFQMINLAGVVVKSWPGDFYINPRFSWSPDKNKVAITQQPANPNPPLPIILYDFTTNQAIKLPTNIVAVSWSNQANYLYAHKRGQPTSSIITLDPNGRQLQTIYQNSLDFGPVEIIEINPPNIIALYESPLNLAKNNQLIFLTKKGAEFDQQVFKTSVDRPLLSPDQKNLILTELDTVNNQTKPKRTIIYDVKRQTQQTLPFVLATNKITWLDNSTVAAALPNKTQLAGEKLVFYNIETKKITVIAESTSGLPVNFNSPSIISNKKVLFFTDNDFLYKLEVDC